MFQRVIVPLDKSDLAERALPVAARIARASGGSLLLVHVVVLPTDSLWESRDRDAAFAEIAEAEQRQAEIYLQEMAHSEILQGIKVDTEVVNRNPARRILEVSRANQADLIVLCSHGYTGIKRWVMGSVARQVVRHSTIPVLLLRPEVHHPSRLGQKKEGSLRVMVPLDGSPRAEEALAPAAFLSRQLSQPEQGMLNIVSVLPLGYPAVYDLIERQQAQQGMENYLSGIEQRLLQEEDADTKLSITASITVNPDVAHALVTLAEADKDTEKEEDAPACDLIVIATHGRGGIARWVMGSVAERVLDATKLPLLIIRPHKTNLLTGDAYDIEPREHFLEREIAGEQSWVGLL